MLRRFRMKLLTKLIRMLGNSIEVESSPNDLLSVYDALHVLSKSQDLVGIVAELIGTNISVMANVECDGGNVFITKKKAIMMNVISHMACIGPFQEDKYSFSIGSPNPPQEMGLQPNGPHGVHTKIGEECHEQKPL
jgi:hypothetical protein